jgi:hypothetical protein
MEGIFISENVMNNLHSAFTLLPHLKKNSDELSEFLKAREVDVEKASIGSNEKFTSSSHNVSQQIDIKEFNEKLNFELIANKERISEENNKTIQFIISEIFNKIGEFNIVVIEEGEQDGSHDISIISVNQSSFKNQSGFTKLFYHNPISFKFTSARVSEIRGPKSL